MRIILTRNAHQSYAEEAFQIHKFGIEGRLPLPSTTALVDPTERVVFHKNWNPFFHFFRGLWMLRGRNDVQFMDLFDPTTYVLSDDGRTVDGAYGARWANQLDPVIGALKRDPDRREVIEIWRSTLDCGSQSRSRPQVTQAMVHVDLDGKLQMVVTCRTHDPIMDPITVEFSMLQEFLASSLGRECGMLHVVSADVCCEEAAMVEELAELAPKPPDGRYSCPYSDGQVKTTVPLMSIPAGRWGRELDTFFQLRDAGTYTDPFFSGVAVPLYKAWVEHVGTGTAAMLEMGTCASQDWLVAGMAWLESRQQ